MKILVTGGAGYVGSHCLRSLCDAGHDAVVLDNLVTGHEAAVDGRARFVRGDIGDEASLRRLFELELFDAVMHFAASLDVGESVRDPIKYYRNNVGNTAVLLGVMQSAGVRKIVFSSTCAIFGEPATLPITEDLPKAPVNPYGRTKLAIEWMLDDCAVAWELGSCALRYFNAAGASSDATLGEDHDPEHHLIPRMLYVAQGRLEKAAIFGTDYPTPDGTCVRDYVHVEDLASVHFLALDAIEPGSILRFNVGTGTGTSVKEIVESARRVTGHAIPADIAERRPGDPPKLFAGPEKIQRELGWSPRFTEIDDIVRSAWNWHESHPRGYA